jgi:hypothetical protein
MFKRFFSFGCSFTNYKWNTWADIIADDLGLEYHNLAQPGMGNVGIMHEIIRADLKYNFTDQDLIIVMWSHWIREDRFINGEWQSHGNVLNNDFYDSAFVKKYWSFENDIIKNSTAIICINKIYQNKIAFQGHIMPPGDFENKKYQASVEELDLMNFYFPHFSKENVFTEFTEFLPDDPHPDVKSHLKYVTDIIYPCLKLKVKETTVKKYLNKDQEIVSLLSKYKSLNQKLSALDQFLS